MEDPSDRDVAKQRRVLGFALGAVGLTSAVGESVYATRLVELEHTVAALLAENRRLRQELGKLETKRDPDAADLEVFEDETASAETDRRPERRRPHGGVGEGREGPALELGGLFGAACASGAVAHPGAASRCRRALPDQHRGSHAGSSRALMGGCIDDRVAGAVIHFQIRT